MDYILRSYSVKANGIVPVKTGSQFGQFVLVPGSDQVSEHQWYFLCLEPIGDVNPELNLSSPDDSEEDEE